ncbi:MAG: septum formation initiator family protein [Akkermansiaceae bacterium]|nr:septum formation initiator family protein [Akkermansiaceae bacterium]
MNRLVGVVVGASVGFVVVASAVPQHRELVKLEEKLEEARALEGNVLAERERMRVEHRALREDPEFLETQARDRLDYCREGERVLRMQRER